MLTPEQIADGWKPHDGGPCPVDEATLLWVIFGDGERWLLRAGDLRWTQSNPPFRYDIIAYKEQSNG